MEKSPITQKINLIDQRSVSSSGSRVILDAPVSSGSGRSRQPNKRQILNAVYGYIQAIRALGKERTTALEIARGLSLPVDLVHAAIHELRARGVEPIT